MLFLPALKMSLEISNLQRLNNIQTIETKRFILTALNNIDKKLYCHLYTDKFLTENLNQCLSIQQAISAFNASLKYNLRSTFSRYTWSIKVKQTSIQNEKIGICALVVDKSKPEIADIGTILIKSVHGKKIATEVLAALIKYAFEKQSLTAIQGFSILKNKVSFKLMSTLGFSYRILLKNNINGYYWLMTKKQWINL